jgi:hypothetical protein
MPKCIQYLVNYIHFLTPLRATNPVTAILIMSLFQHCAFDTS